MSCRPLVLLLGLLLGGCQPAAPFSKQASNQPSPQAAQPPLPGYAQALATQQRGLAEVQAAIANPQASAQAQLALAAQYLVLAQLTGDYRNYSAAQQAIDAAFLHSSGNLSPYFARAKLNFTLHRLAAAQQDLTQAAPLFNPSPGALAEREGLAADLAFYNGHYAAAIAAYRQSLQTHETVAGLVRLAVAYARTGHSSEALALLHWAEASLPAPKGQLFAFLALQQGLVYLDMGRYDLALAHYSRADRGFPGWWLVQEHMAEALNLQGETAAAEALYRQVIPASGLPEYQDALANLLNNSQRSAEASPLLASARMGFESRLHAFPEAAAGHALDFYLNHGPLSQAVTLAQQNARTRPYGEAQIKLAQALLANGQARLALSTLQAPLAAGWRTPQLFVTQAAILRTLGQTHACAGALQNAKTLNPNAERQYAMPSAAPLAAVPALVAQQSSPLSP